MVKVAMIGAGSVVFSKNLTGDILSIPAFKDARISYMDIDAERLEVAGKLCRKLADAIGATPTIETTMDRRQALQGADFVINMVQIGGFNSTLVDFEIPRKYGLNFTIADTTGPGGLFRALRTFPMLSGLCRDIEAVCPDAYLLNYSNPMSMNMQTVFRTSSVRAVGLCHSVQGTFNQLMGYLGEKPEDVTFTCAGINHMAFYLAMRKGSVDLYPRLFKAMERSDVYNTNRVRFELMKRLGHFVTESSEHNAEYCSFFIPHGVDQIRRFQVPIDEYLRRCDNVVEEFERLKTFVRSPDPLTDVHISHEYCSTIMNSICTGTPSVIYGNLPNGGTISNLPRTAIVEAPTLVDRSGLHHIQVGELPPQIVGYIQPHITQHELFIRAATSGRRDHVYQACMFDPLTAATLTMDRIVEMCDEMITTYGDELPRLDAPMLVPTSGKVFAKIDPAALRRSWDQAQSADEADFIKDWHVIGPFPSPKPGEVSLSQPTAVEADFLARGDGAVDLAKTYASQAIAAAGAGAAILAKPLVWQKSVAPKRGFVSLDRQMGRTEWAIAYGYAEVTVPKARTVDLGIGSDDGVRLWLNGKIVHENDTARGHRAHSDTVSVQLAAGVNRLLVKIDNYRGGWGFSVAVLEPVI